MHFMEAVGSSSLMGVVREGRRAVHVGKIRPLKETGSVSRVWGVMLARKPVITYVIFRQIIILH